MQRLQDRYPPVVHQYKNVIGYILQTGSEGFQQKPNTVTLLSLKSKGEDRGEVGTWNERERQRASWCSLLNASETLATLLTLGVLIDAKP